MVNLANRYYEALGFVELHYLSMPGDRPYKTPILEQAAYTHMFKKDQIVLQHISRNDCLYK